MVYDNTLLARNGVFDFTGERGYAIHEGINPLDNHVEYDVFTDDGYGNGDHVCTTSDLFWARRIAGALDVYHEQ